MKNKIVLITGATDGIGKQTAHGLVLLGAQVIIHGRNKNRVEETEKQLRIENLACQQEGGELIIDGVTFDLSSIKQVKSFAETIKSKYERIDVLINNAGVYMKERVLTEDGFEMTFAVNHLSHFLLTNELLPLIEKSLEGRIVTVSSIAHQNASLDFDNLNTEKKFSGYGAYSLSKLANVLFSKELAERLKGTVITSNTLHPGVISTKLLVAGFNMSGASVMKGAETSVYLASSSDVKNISGEYFVDKKISRYHTVVDDLTSRKRFWDISLEMISGI